MMADKLWYDRDLNYQPEDLVRARALHFEDHPAGIFLTRNGEAYRYAKPVVYPLFALPFYAALGVRGFFVLNGLLLAGIVLGLSAAADPPGWPAPS